MNENTMMDPMQMAPAEPPPADMQGGERPALNKQAILDIANRDPRFQQAIDMIEQQISGMPIMAGDVQEIIKMLEYVLQHPENYEQVRAAAIKDGVVTEDQAPPQFDQVFVISLLVALYGVEERLTKQGFARGGLAVARSLANQGRGGDTMLAHINPREAEVLRRMGGSGTINPNTGLREFKGGGLLGAILPIALSVIAPGLGTIIGTSLGATGVGASMLGSAIIGGASSALTGGNVLQGALMGGLGGGLGGVVGNAANSTLGLGLGKAGESILGSGLVGGVAGMATGKGFLGGATQGALGGAIGNAVGTGSGFGGAAGRSFGNALTVGYDPKAAALTALAAGGTQYTSNALSGTPDSSLGLKMKPADMTVDGLKTSLSTVGSEVPTGLYQNPYSDTGGLKYVDTGTQNANYSLGSPSAASDTVRSMSGNFSTVPSNGGISNNLMAPAGYNNPIGASIGTQTAGGGGGLSGFGGAGNLATMALLASSMQRPPDAQKAISGMSPSQQEYFNRPSVQWDWARMQQDANRANQSLDSYMATNWNKITSGTYNTPVHKLAQGGPLSMIGRFAQGAGSGREDTIDAKLSDGEYVMDAETVALLGDGSNKEGALRLDAMRQQLRKQKGKEMAKGKFSPNAKSPLQYLKGAA